MSNKLAAALATLALMTAAHADTVVFDASGYNSGEVVVAGGFAAQGFSSPAGPGAVAFTLTGYGTLDGQNSYEDDFTLTVNGVDVLVGTFNLGGGGANVLYSAPSGTLVSGYDTDPGSITRSGGQLTFFVPITLLAADNEIDFTYESLAAPAHAGFQGTGDEGWGLSEVTVTASTLAVPEPGSLALLLAGLGMVGGLAWRRNRV